MDYSSSTAELYEPQELSNTTVITCEFCYRPAEISVEKIIHGNLELVWLCNHCIKSRMFIKDWEVISND